MPDSSKFDAETIDQFDRTAKNYSKDNLILNGYDLNIMLKQAYPNTTIIVLDVAMAQF